MSKLDEKTCNKLVDILNAASEFFDCDKRTYPFISTFRGKLCIYIPYKDKWGVVFIKNIETGTLHSEMHKLRIEFNYQIRNDKELKDDIYIIG